MNFQTIDLFSGVGGFSIAGHAAGWETIQFCELNKYLHYTLNKNFPDVPIETDIFNLTFEKIKTNGKYKFWKPTVVMGGFPCPEFSVAGTGGGDLTLWKQMFRIISEVKPSWCIIENVPGLITNKQGVSFNEVLTDLENKGYEVQPVVIGAVAKNAPHIRQRVWIIAHHKGAELQSTGGTWNGRAGFANGNFTTPNPDNIGGWEQLQQCSSNAAGTWKKSDRSNSERINAINPNLLRCNNGENINGKIIYNKIGQQTIEKQKRSKQQCGACKSDWNVSNTQRNGSNEIHNNLQQKQPTRESINSVDWTESWYEAAARLCILDDGISVGVDGQRLRHDIERMFNNPSEETKKTIERTIKRFIGRERKEQIMAYGNAIVPQVLLEICECINKIENQKQ